MRIVGILLIAFLMVGPVVAHATLAWIEFQPNVNGGVQQGCNFIEPAGAGLREVAVVLAYSSENLTGVRFAIQQSDINWQRLGITSTFTTIGDYSDLSVGFGGCVSSPVVMATILYYSPGSSPCGAISAVAAPLLPGILATLCDFSETSIYGGHMTVNGVYDTAPGAPDPDCFCGPVATEQSSWGKVKALYR